MTMWGGVADSAIFYKSIALFIFYGVNTNLKHASAVI